MPRYGHLRWQSGAAAWYCIAMMDSSLGADVFTAQFGGYKVGIDGPGEVAHLEPRQPLAHVYGDVPAAVGAAFDTVTICPYLLWPARMYGLFCMTADAITVRGDLCHPARRTDAL